MEQLHRRSDGIAETPSGLFAVTPRTKSGVTGNGVAWFEFRASYTTPVVRIEWDDRSPFIVIDGETANQMLRLGYADNISDEQLALYATAFDAWQAGQGAAPIAPAPAHPLPAPEAAPPAPVATPEPVAAGEPPPAPVAQEEQAPAPVAPPNPAPVAETPEWAKPKK